MRPRPFAARLAFVLVLLAAGAAADEEVFDVVELTDVGRVVTADVADFDGDGSKDLMLVTLDGMPPDEVRSIHVHRQTRAGQFSPSPDLSVILPPDVAVYDIADIEEAPGDELILLRPDRITVISLSEQDGNGRDWLIDGPTTLGVAADERGFERFRLAYEEFDDRPWILVPQFGALSLLTAEGQLQVRLDVGRRANYYVASGSGLLSVESDMQLYYDAPKISVGDIDGDGQADILTATRHELRVFLRGPDGEFKARADYAEPLGLIDETDHRRGTSSVVTSARDIDADGRLDLMISHIEGTMVSTVTNTRIYFNRDGGWDLAEPDEEFVVDGAVTSNLLVNIDRSEVLELVRLQFKFSILELVELLLTRKIDTEILIHRLQADARFGEEPWSRKKISTGISFDTFRPKGFMPRAGLDLNADGLMDFISSANGDGIEIFLGGEKGPFDRRTAIQKLPATGEIYIEDVDADGLPDFVLFDPQSLEPIVRIGLNRGVLPGTPDATARRARENGIGFDEDGDTDEAR